MDIHERLIPGSLYLGITRGTVPMGAVPRRLKGRYVLWGRTIWRETSDGRVGERLIRLGRIATKRKWAVVTEGHDIIPLAEAWIVRPEDEDRVVRRWPLTVYGLYEWLSAERATRLLEGAIGNGRSD